MMARQRVATGFTLIELVVVMMIMALLASLAMVSLGASIDRYRLARAVDAIETFDARARRDARVSHTSLVAQFDRRRGELRIDDQGSGQPYLVRVPVQVGIAELRRGRTKVLGNQAKLEFRADGSSLSYAIRLLRGKSERWLVVLGRSGQVVACESEQEVDAILSL